MLRQALDVLRERGWHQGDYYNPDPDSTCVCAVGALNVASGLPVNFDDVADHPREHALRVLSYVVAARSGDRHIPTWNDEDGRTQDEVEAAFAAAIAVAEAEEAHP